MAGKPGLVLAIGMGKPKKSDMVSEDKSASDMMSEDFVSAADAAFDAIKEDDRKGFQMALKAALLCCNEEESPEEDSTETSEE